MSVCMESVYIDTNITRFHTYRPPRAQSTIHTKKLCEKKNNRRNSSANLTPGPHPTPYSLSLDHTHVHTHKSTHRDRHTHSLLPVPGLFRPPPFSPLLAFSFHFSPFFPPCLVFAPRFFFSPQALKPVMELPPLIQYPVLILLFGTLSLPFTLLFGSGSLGDKGVGPSTPAPPPPAAGEWKREGKREE